MITYNIVREGFSWCAYKDNHNLLAVVDTYGEAVELCLADVENNDVMDFEILSPKTASKKMADDTFTYQMLSRLQQDIEYYLGNGGYCANNLWAGEESEQINEMRRLYDSLPENAKPEWLTKEDIDNYEALLMSHKTASKKTANIHLDYIEDPDNNTVVMDTLINAYLDGLTGKAISTLGSTAYAGEFVEREFEYENPFHVLEFCARNEVTENDYGMLYRWTNTDCTYIERVNERDVYLAIEDMAEDIVKDFDTYNLWEKVGE